SARARGRAARRKIRARRSSTSSEAGSLLVTGNNKDCVGAAPHEHPPAGPLRLRPLERPTAEGDSEGEVSMGRQLPIAATRQDEVELLQFVSTLAPIRVFQTFASSPEELWI